MKLLKSVLIKVLGIHFKNDALFRIYIINLHFVYLSLSMHNLQITWDIPLRFVTILCLALKSYLQLSQIKLHVSL